MSPRESTPLSHLHIVCLSKSCSFQKAVKHTHYKAESAKFVYILKRSDTLHRQLKTHSDALTYM